MELADLVGGPVGTEHLIKNDGIHGCDRVVAGNEMTLCCGTSRTVSIVFNRTPIRLTIEIRRASPGSSVRRGLNITVFHQTFWRAEDRLSIDPRRNPRCDTHREYPYPVSKL